MTVSKMPKTVPGLQENMGQNWLGMHKWAGKVRSIIALGSVTQSIVSYWVRAIVMLEGLVLVPIMGCFSRRVFHLSQETLWKVEPN